MFVICDKNNLVVDMATRQENLSRGFQSVDYKVYADVTEIDMLIGDTFADDILTCDPALRLQIQEQAANETKIADYTRQTAIDDLIASGDLPPDFGA